MRKHLPEEPSTLWALISRISVVLIVLILLAGAALNLLPKIREHEEADKKLAELQARKEQAIQERDALRTHYQMLNSADPAYLELHARDRLDLQKDGEVIFRFDDQKEMKPQKVAANSP